MKKIIYTLSIMFLSLTLMQGCKKGDKPGMEINSGDVIKYAKSAAAAYKDQDLKVWGATLAKTEPVKLLETVNVPVKGGTVEIAKIKLSDNTVLFISPKNLADKPVVFVEDTKAYVRNNASSKVFAIIPKGTIGFVVQESGEWVQVYVGKLEDKWVTEQWVNSGFTAEEIRVQEAKLYEESAAIMKNPAAKSDQKKQAEANLKDLTTSTGIFADMARSIIQPGEGMGDAGTDMNSDGGFMRKATVQATAGLTMRDQPSQSGRSIMVIPDGSTVTILNTGGAEETIAGKTSVWYEVEWNGQKGWVFGGFLAF